MESGRQKAKGPASRQQLAGNRTDDRSSATGDGHIDHHVGVRSHRHLVLADRLEGKPVGETLRLDKSAQLSGPSAMSKLVTEPNRRPSTPAFCDRDRLAGQRLAHGLDLGQRGSHLFEIRAAGLNS